MVDQMRLTPAFRERGARVLEERGASPFEARRFFWLPAAAQVAGLRWLEYTSIGTRELMTDLEEIAEQQRARIEEQHIGKKGRWQ